VARRTIFRTGPLKTPRLEAFSDGVLAVASTLLVLNIKLSPGLKDDNAIWAGFGHIAPMLAAWAVSFAFVLTFWVSHHYFIASLRNVDRGLLWLNGLFLLSMSLIPFPTGLVGEHPGLKAPLVLLSAVMLLASTSFALMRGYASFHGRLLREHISPAAAARGMVHGALGPLLYAVAVALAFVWPPGAIALQVLVLLIFFLRSPIDQAATEAEPTGRERGDG
jgi:uncharacterized membrane protein